jgi:RNA polymerase sigma-70 factor (ECF subfamily)
MKVRDDGLGQSGFTVTWEWLYEEYYPVVVRFCRRNMHCSQEEAEDNASEVILRAYCARDTLDGTRPIVSWIIKIDYNFCVDEGRKRKRRFTTVPLEIDVVGPGPEEELAVLEFEASIGAVLCVLAEQHREVITLVFFEDRTYTEAAEILNVPIGTVRSRVHRAMIELRKAIVQRKINFDNFGRYMA